MMSRMQLRRTNLLTSVKYKVGVFNAASILQSYLSPLCTLDNIICCSVLMCILHAVILIYCIIFFEMF